VLFRLARAATLHEEPPRRGRALDPQPCERVGGREPPARCLRGLALRAEVVVAALGLNRLALQVARVPPALAGGDAGCGHHMGY
jgi:hypothetical protein